MTTYRDMKAQITKLEKQAADLFKKEVTDAISKIKALMNDYGLSIADLGMRAKSGRTASPKQASAAKYRDPVSGKTWTGHGKAPGWLVAAVQAGKSREDFLITKAVATKVAPTVKGAAPKAKAKPAAKTTSHATRKSPAPKAVAKPAPQKKASLMAPAKKAPAKAASKAPAKSITKKPAAKLAKATAAPKAVTPPATSV